MSNPQTPRFIWEQAVFGDIPRWLSLPDITVIETLCRSHLQLPADHQVAVSFFSEGAFNKLYTVGIPDSDGNIGPPRYIFRATFPAEPFYKTASEVATLSYLRERTTIPVPRVIAHSSTAENEVGCEWILMEKIPGISLKTVWKDTDLETKSKQTKVIAGFVRQLRDLGPRFSAIGNLYFREDIDTSNGAVGVVPTENEKYVLGPIVTCFMFIRGRKLRLPRNLGPYSNDAEYMTALAASELEDMKLLLSADAHLLHDFDQDLAEDAESIVELLNEIETLSADVFPSRPRDYVLHHDDLSLSNVLIDSTTYDITGIVDWECVGTRPHWEDTHPQFLCGPLEEIAEEAEPPDPGDSDSDDWESWVKTELRPVFHKDSGGAPNLDDGKDEIRLELMYQLYDLAVFPNRVRTWLRDYGARDKIALCAQ